MLAMGCKIYGQESSQIPCPWSKQWRSHSSVGDNVCHYVRQKLNFWALQKKVKIVSSLLTLYLSLFCILTRLCLP